MVRSHVIGIFIIASLSGCGELSLTKAGDESAVDISTETLDETKENDRTLPANIEAPEVFRVVDMALWDGRPTFGGVWVAHPDVTVPERVIIRNTANSSTVTGALFRRERNNPGPRIQVSADAAAELSLTAGTPVELEIVALVSENDVR